MKPRPRKLGWLAGGSVAAVLGCYFLLPFAFQVPDAITSGPGSSVILLDRDGEQLGDWVRSDYYRHRATSLEEIPQDLVLATLAAEDKRFHEHGGIDFRATARALRDSWDKGRFVSGASTVTQQTVKLSSQKSSRTLPTKIRECLTARHVEMSHSKNEILTAYFNHLDYGNLSQGPLQAARHYFSKPLSQLSLAECALLAGLPQAPSRLNPRRNPEAALKRRNWILDRMALVWSEGSDRIARAKAEPLQLYAGKRQSLAPHLVQLMRYTSDLKGHTSIRTTISASLQRDVTEIVREQIKALSKKHIQHAAVVVIHNPTGEVLALVGSPDFHQTNSGQIDATRTPRSPGSALKPFTYLLAFENGGMTPATIIEDIPTRFADARGEKSFVNYDRHYKGPVTIHHALANSLNVPAIRALNAIGGAQPLQESLQSFGISTLNEKPIHYGLGLTLGSGNVTLLELTNAYATLGRMGVYKPVSFIPDTTQEKKHVASYQSTWMLAQTMSNNAARSAAFGTHSHLRLPFPCAVKTGTSTDFRDNWCLGFTAEFTVGVWAGNLDNTPMRGISGVTGAGPIFNATMLRLHQDQQPRWFKEPNGMMVCHIDPHTGKRHATASSKTLRLTLPTNRAPLPAKASDYDSKNRVLLETRYSEWFSSEADKAKFALRKTQHSTLTTQNSPLRILSPSREAEYLLDPDLPGNGRRLKLITDFSGQVTWESPTLTITDNATAILLPGEHMIILRDKQGRKTSRKIIVTSL
ncbi:MAG: penicillin-binding protein 1C [Akkermansiaceae bacterium]